MSKKLKLFTLTFTILLLVAAVPLFVFAENEGTSAVAEEGEVTSYGTIPSEYDAETYPWAIFSEGKFITAVQDYSATETTSVLTWLKQNDGNDDGESDLYKGKDIQILLRSDYEVHSTKYADDPTFWTTYDYGKLTFDLGGHKYTKHGKFAFVKFFLKNTITPAAAELNINVINGTMIQPKTNDSKYNLFYVGGEGGSSGDHKGINLYVSNVTFDVKVANDTYNNASIGLFASGIANDPATPKFDNYPFNLTFDNCKMDTSNGGLKTPQYRKENCITSSGDVRIDFNVNCKHSYSDTDGVCDFCGEEIPVSLVKYSTTLYETLGINFYAKLPANVVKAVITVAGVPTTIEGDALKACYISENDYYKLSSSVSSVNVREDITIQFFDEDGTAINTESTKGTAASYTTSVFDYAVTLMDNSDAKVAAAAKALLTYAAYAEVYFSTEADAVNTAYSTYIMDLESESIDTTESVSATGTISVLGKVQLDLDNATTIRIFINSDEAIAVSGTDEASVTKFEGYIEISGIDAKDLNRVYSFTVNGANVEVSATAIAKYVINQNADADAVNLMKALCLYSAAAEELQ